MPQTHVTGPVQEPAVRTGLVLVLGDPQETVPHSQYQAEIVRPDGSRSLQQQEVERDASGRPKAIVIVCKEYLPDYGGVR